MPNPAPAEGCRWAPSGSPRRGAFCALMAIWHAKCISEGRSLTYLPGGHGLARYSPCSGRGLSFLLGSRRRYRVADAKRPCASTLMSVDRAL